MSLPNVGQAKLLSDVFGWSIEAHSPNSVAVLGCAGGNGFNRLHDNPGVRIVGIDINPDYIEQARNRYANSLPGLELVVADIERSRLRLSPVELVFAGLIFEYVDVNKALRNIKPLLSTGGILVVVLQSPSSDMDKITPSPYKSLGLLEGHIRLIPEDDFTSSADHEGFVIKSSRIVNTMGGKQFFIGEYYEKETEQKNEPGS